MKNPITYFFWLLAQASSGVFSSPVFVVLLGLAILTLVFFILNQREALIREAKFLPLPLIGTIFILLSGTIFEDKPFLVFMPDIGMGLTLILAGVSIFKTKIIWPLTLMTSILILMVSYACVFLSSMSIDGGWV